MNFPLGNYYNIITLTIISTIIVLVKLKFEKINIEAVHKFVDDEKVMMMKDETY